MTTSEPADSTTGTKPKKSSLVLTILSAVFILAILITGTVMILTRDKEPETPAAPPTTSAPPGPREVQDRGDGYGQPITDPWGRRVEVPVNPYGNVLPQNDKEQLSPTDPGWLTEPAKGVEWQLIFNRPVPFSTSDGPARLDGRNPAGFAHTPQGAVLAVMHTFNCVNAWGENWAPECFDERVTDGPDYDFTRQVAVELGQRPRQGGPGQPTLPPMMAARFDNYAPDYAVVWVALRDHSTLDERYVLSRAEVFWEDGDWRIKATKSADSIVRDIVRLDGFTRW